MEERNRKGVPLTCSWDEEDEEDEEEEEEEEDEEDEEEEEWWGRDSSGVRPWIPFFRPTWIGGLGKPGEPSEVM